MNIYSIFRPFLFTLNAECAHRVTLLALKIFAKCIKNPELLLPTKIFGLTFKNPVGLAAGFDKNGECIDALFRLGFGFVEVGTVTPRPQPGNVKPRLFRFPKQRAVLNRMGFNNKGVDYLVKNLKKRKSTGILGANIGKNFDTPLAHAIEDYIYCLKKVYPFVDYVTVNISSPNTASLRDLQSKQYLPSFLQALKENQTELAQRFERYVPILIKIAPDQTAEELENMAEIFLKAKIDGIIATNTTINSKIKKHLQCTQEGGISGEPLLPLTIEVVSRLNKLLAGRISIVGVGGIFSSLDAEMLMHAGASLIQMYTGLVFQGPKLIEEIVQDMKKNTKEVRT